MRAQSTFQRPIDEIFADAWSAGALCERDRRRLDSSLKGNATHEEKAIAHRLLHAVRRGWIQTL